MLIIDDLQNIEFVNWNLGADPWRAAVYAALAACPAAIGRVTVAFDLEKLFIDVFAPRRGDVVTIMYDLPHGEIRDCEEWRLRREMASAWHRKLGEFANRYEFTVNPIVTYQATGAHNSDMPSDGVSQGQAVRLENIIKGSTIILSMTQYSASAPLLRFTGRYENLRVASMPGVTQVNGGDGACRRL